MMSVAHALQRERIIPFKMEGDYLAAKRFAEERKMKLPSNVLHDEYLSTDRWRALGALYPAWGREIVVYPEKGGKFRIGMDVEDQENGWTFPACYLPREAVGREKVALFFEPLAVVCEGGRMVVHPEPLLRMVLLHPFIQESGKGGLMDNLTGMPLDIQPADLRQKRYLCRRNGAGVTPVARFTYGSRVSEQHVFAKNIPEDSFGFSGVGYL
jgi:hypothetical protein